MSVFIAQLSANRRLFHRSLLVVQCGLFPRIANHAESIIRILKGWRNAGAGGHPAHFYVVPPRASARSPALSRVGSLRIVPRRLREVIGLVPIRAPLMHIFTKVVNAVRIWRGLPHGQRSQHIPAPTLLVCCAALWHVITPGIEPAFVTSTRGSLPFSLGGQAIVAARRARQPLAIFLRLDPTDGHDRMVGIVKSPLF